MTHLFEAFINWAIHEYLQPYKFVVKSVVVLVDYASQTDYILNSLVF